MSTAPSLLALVLSLHPKVPFFIKDINNLNLLAGKGLVNMSASCFWLDTCTTLHTSASLSSLTHASLMLKCPLNLECHSSLPFGSRLTLTSRWAIYLHWGPLLGPLGRLARRLPTRILMIDCTRIRNFGNCTVDQGKAKWHGTMQGGGNVHLLLNWN